MKTTIFALIAISLMVTSCHVNYEKTKSGLTYKIISGKSGGTQAKAGNIVKFNMEYAMPEKDTVLNSTYGKVPIYDIVDTSANIAYSYKELLPKLKEGDSVVFNISVDTLKSRKAIPEYNNTFKRGDQIKCKMSIIKIFPNESVVRADYEKEVGLEKDREVKDLQDYLDKKGIKAQKTKNGAFVALSNPGDQSVKADSGKQVSIMYKGYFQSNGKVFDTNMDSSKGHTEPIQFVIKRDPIIPGWQEAIPLFGKGGKGTIYIPAMLGYGMQGREGAIPPYANLVFDIDLLDVKDAPPVQPNQNPYGLTPEQMQQMQQQMQQRRQQQQQQAPAAH